MAKPPKKVEMFQVIFQREPDDDLTFEDVLLSETIKKGEVNINGKNVSINILESGKVIIGIVETTRYDNIPPKKNRKKKYIKPLGLEPEEGLVYANVFLYEKRRGILLYEINKYGTYSNHFFQAIKNCCQQDENWDRRFTASHNVLIKSEEYKRLLKMNFYKSIELKLTNPKQILVEEYASKTNALKDILNPIIQLNTETFTGKFEVRSKRQGGKSLNSKTIREISEDLLKLMGFKKGNENIHKVVVRGYSVDEDDYVEKLDPIDLIADRLIGKITLEEPLENTDLLQQQRKQQIKELYNKFLPHFNSILGA